MSFRQSVTRPDPILPNTSFAKLLPPPNRMIHSPLHPPASVDQVRQSVASVLGDIHLLPVKNDVAGSWSLLESEGSIILSPRRNTWSRSARRQAARTTASGEAGSAEQSSFDRQAGGDDQDSEIEPLMRVRLSFIPPAPPVSEVPVGEVNWRGAALALDFLEGRDRAIVDAFWKFLLTKAGFLGRAEIPGGGLRAGLRGGRTGRGERGRQWAYDRVPRSH